MRCRADTQQKENGDETGAEGTARVAHLEFLSCGVLAQNAGQTERTTVGEYELGETYEAMFPSDEQKKMDTVCSQAEAQYAASIPNWFLKDQHYQIDDGFPGMLQIAFRTFFIICRLGNVNERQREIQLRRDELVLQGLLVPSQHFKL